jgi:hypothetical protein
MNVDMEKATWIFVEKYYPNYDGCSNITMADELFQILFDDITDIDKKDDDFKELVNQPKEKIQELYNSLMMKIYQEAIFNFMTINKIEE